MKHSLLYIAAATLAASAALTACDNEFAYPPAIWPDVVEIEGNTGILDIKTEYWSSLSSPTTIPYTENGDTLIFIGRVCSSDKTGNVFKNVVIQSRDENGEQIAMTFSVNSYDLYEIYPFGQEVAVYASGLQIGGYRSLLQFGAIAGKEMTFMDKTIMTEHVVRNHSFLPDPSKVDTTLATIAKLNAAKTDQNELMRWQSRLIRIDGVTWKDAGQPFAGSQTANRTITDAEGNTINVRNSSYADFANELLPYGTGSVVGILGTFNNDWQITLLDAEGCIGFDGEAPEPVEPIAPAGTGTEADPYNVAKAIEVTKALAADATSEEVYVKGIIASLGEFSADFGNYTYNIADREGGESFMIYRGKWLNGEKFTSADQLAVGASIVVKGQLINFKGNTPEMQTGNTVVSYNGQTGGGTETPNPTPDPTGTLEFAKVTTVTSGAKYVLVVDGQFGAAIGKTLDYGRFNLTDATITDGKFSTDAVNAFTLTEVAGKGYTMVDAYGRFLSMDAEHLTTFQIFSEAKDGSYWTVAFEADGKASIKNALNTDCVVCVSQGNQGTYYTNMAPAKSPTTFKLPELYKAN